MAKRQIVGLLSTVFILGGIATTVIPVPAYADGLGIFSKDKAKSDTPPTISMKSDLILVEKGAKDFNLKDALELKVEDETDGDLTDKMELPSIDVNTVGKKTFELSITNSQKLATTKEITVNVIGFKEPLYVPTFSEVDNIDYSKLLEGDVDGLKISVKDKSENDKTVSLRVEHSSGAYLDKKMTVMVEKEESGSSTVGGGHDISGDLGEKKDTTTQTKPNTNNASSTTNSSVKQETTTKELPKTGDVSSSVAIIGGLTALIGTSGAYCVAKKKRK